MVVVRHFSLSFNGGSAFGGLATGVSCAGLQSVTPAVNTTITAVDIGGGTPGVAIQAITPGVVDGLCGGGVALQYTVDFLCLNVSSDSFGGTFNTPPKYR